MLPRDQRLPCECHQYNVCPCIKGKWSTLETKAEAKDILGSGGNKKRKQNKGRSKTFLSLHIRGAEGDTPLGSVLL